MPLFDARTMQDLYTQRAVKAVERHCPDGERPWVCWGWLLATVGLYGLMAYSVSRRTREIGIRMALGAERRSVVWMVLRQGLVLGVAGVTVGLVAAFYACRAITSAMIELFTFKRVDPMIFIAVPLLLLLITVLAAWAPARRAARVDPLTSLRDE